MFVSEVEFMLHKKQLNRIIKIQELKLKLLEKEIKINKIDTRIQLTAMAAILKPSEMSDTDFVLKINEKMSELWSEEALIRQDAKINQELLEIQKTLDEIEKLCNLIKDGRTVISSLTSVSRRTANGAPLVYRL